MFASVLQLLVQTHTSALCDASSQGAYSACIRSIGARIGGAGPSVVPTMARAAALQSAAALTSMSTETPQTLRRDALPFREMVDCRRASVLWSAPVRCPREVRRL